MKINQFVFAFVFLLLNASSISALCEDGQIDVNNASLEELQRFTGIGPAKSQAIIDYRNKQPFNSVDDLINVYGIGQIILGNMKNEGACVKGDSEKPETDESNNSDLEDDLEDEAKELNAVENNEINKKEEVIYSNEPIAIRNENVINLNNPVEDNKVVYESKNEKIGKYAIYGFAVFLIFVILVLLIKE